MGNSANKHLLTEILKQELGFEGFLISDYNAIDQISPDYKKDVEISINAGIDMVMLTDKYPELFKDLQELVHEGKIPAARIDDAVTRHPGPRQIRARPDGQGSLPAGRPRPAKILRLRCAPAGRAAGGARVAGAAQERKKDSAAGEDGTHPRRRPRAG